MLNCICMAPIRNIFCILIDKPSSFLFIHQAKSSLGFDSCMWWYCLFHEDVVGWIINYVRERERESSYIDKHLKPAKHWNKLDMWKRLSRNKRRETLFSSLFKLWILTYKSCPYCLKVETTSFPNKEAMWSKYSLVDLGAIQHFQGTLSKSMQPGY